MTNRQTIIFLALATFSGSLVMSCRDAAELSESERAGVAQEVTSVLLRYYNDIRTSGLVAELNYLDSSEYFFWVPPGYSTALSYDSVVAILKKNAASLSIVDNSFDTLVVTPLSRELAMYTGRLRSVVIDTSGARTESLLMETGIMIKRRDGWKLLSGQTGMVEVDGVRE